MSDIFNLISESFDKFGFIPTMYISVITIGLMYFLNKFTKQSGVQAEQMARVIKENRDMSEAQLATLNTLVGKITTMVDFTQRLVGHILEKEGD